MPWPISFQNRKTSGEMVKFSTTWSVGHFWRTANFEHFFFHPIQLKWWILFNFLHRNELYLAFSRKNYMHLNKWVQNDDGSVENPRKKIVHFSYPGYVLKDINMSIHTNFCWKHALFIVALYSHPDTSALIE